MTWSPILRGLPRAGAKSKVLHEEVHKKMDLPKTCVSSEKHLNTSDQKKKNKLFSAAVEKKTNQCSTKASKIENAARLSNQWEKKEELDNKIQIKAVGTFARLKLRSRDCTNSTLCGHDMLTALTGPPCLGLQSNPHWLPDLFEDLSLRKHRNSWSNKVSKHNGFEFWGQKIKFFVHACIFLVWKQKRRSTGTLKALTADCVGMNGLMALCLKVSGVSGVYAVIPEKSSTRGMHTPVAKECRVRMRLITWF